MNLFSYLKTRIFIMQVVSEYTTLKKAGLYWKGQCPFHTEKTASFTVSPHKEIFYCFGCHVGGDVIAFIARMEHCSQKEAAYHLIDRYQIELPAILAHDIQEYKPDNKRYFQICQGVATWAHAQLLKAEHALSYLASRGISKKTIEHFMIGYIPGGLSQIKKMTADLAKESILVEELIENAILARSKQVLFSPFEERIIFPIMDHLGRPCGFGGRIFKMNDSRPKYYNSHENEHFAKGKLLFGLDKAKKNIQESQELFLVEGYIDCILMCQNGFPNTIATLGTACTLDHLLTLSRYAAQVFALYDGDSAGQQAILRIGELCWQASIELKVICLPLGEDPASFLEKGNNLQFLIEQAKDIFAFYIDTLGINFSQKTLNQKLELTRKILSMIQKIEEPLKQDFLLQTASQKLQIPPDSLKKELKRLEQKEESKVHRPSLTTQPKILPPSLVTPLEKKIFLSIMNNIHLINKSNEELLITYLPHPLCDILKKLQEEKEKEPTLGFIQFFELLSEADQHYTSKILLAYQEDSKLPLFDQLILQLQKKRWKEIVTSIKLKLNTAKEAGNEEEIAIIMRNFMDMKKKIISRQNT